MVTPGEIRLLIVDDDDVDRDKLRRVLAKTSLQVSISEAESSADALAQLRSNEFDCVLVDYRLGDVTGTELVRRIKQEYQRPFPVIMVTGLGDERVAVEAMREGVYDYLAKNGLTPQSLATAIEGCMHSTALARQLADAQERLKRLSLYDGLTTLPNRNLFFDRLEQLIAGAGRGGPGFALLMMDLNRFKEVNDNLGHEAGDKVLAEVAQRMQALARTSDTYARLGGDEFAALLVGTDSAAGAIVVAEKIGAAVREPILVGNELISIGISVGVALYPEHGDDARSVLANADQAMYRGKAAGRDYEVYVHATTRESRNFAIGNHVSESVTRSELFLHYQPKIHLCSGVLAGVEALARWRSPHLGTVGPSEFIPAAERSSIIQPMTYKILDMALAQAKSWLRTGWCVPISVNLSARVLDDEQLVERVEAALAAHEIPPRMLTLEITETALMSNVVRAQQALRRLRRAGVGISIDDFGTGYTSIKYLRDFEISEIKIDKTFVTMVDPNGRDAWIVRAIAALGRGVQVDLVAEGIESPASCRVLEELGCNLGQGYGIARPMRADELGQWARERELPDSSSGTYEVAIG